MQPCLWPNLTQKDPCIKRLLGFPEGLRDLSCAKGLICRQKAQDQLQSLRIGHQLRGWVRHGLVWARSTSLSFEETQGHGCNKASESGTSRYARPAPCNTRLALHQQRCQSSAVSLLKLSLSHPTRTKGVHRTPGVQKVRARLQEFVNLS